MGAVRRRPGERSDCRWRDGGRSAASLSVLSPAAPRTDGRVAGGGGIRSRARNKIPPLQGNQRGGDQEDGPADRGASRHSRPDRAGEHRLLHERPQGRTILMYEWTSLWVSALLTLMIFSFLYRDNPFYKFAEHLFVGVSAAYWMVTAFWNVLMPNMIGKIHPAALMPFSPQLATAKPEPLFWIPLVFGLLLLTRLVPKFDYLSRWSIGLIVGWTAGTNMMRYMQSDFVGQIYNTIRPVIATSGGHLLWIDSFSNVVIIVGVVCGLIYFFFSKEHTGAFGGAARVGIWYLMVTFGAAFGYTVMARISLLIGRMQALGLWISQGFRLPGT